jgi:hypothetical protein
MFCFNQRHKVVAYAIPQSLHGSAASPFSRFFQGFLFTPIFRYSSERPFNILTGAELNNDRHNTTNRPYFAGRNIGIAPSFWAFDTRLSRRFAVGERTSLELVIEALNLLTHRHYGSVNNTVSCSASLPLGSAGSCYTSDIVAAIRAA